MKSFIDTLEAHPEELASLINYKLIEAVFHIRRSGVLDPDKAFSMASLLYQDLATHKRATELITDAKKKKVRQELFGKALEQITNSQGSNELKSIIGTQNFDKIVQKIYTHPEICPALSLAFEMFNSLVDDKADKLKPGDFSDLVHVDALPYVDLFVADARIANHVSKVSRKLNIDYHKKIRKNVREVVDSIATENSHGSY